MMTAWLQTSGLLAQMSRWQRMGDGLHRSGSRASLSDLLPYIIALVVVGIGAAIAMAMVRRNDMTQACNDPGKMFRELSRAHRLNFSSQRLLQRLATAVGLEQPAEVFLTPAAFDAKKLPAPLQAEAVQIQALRNQLF